MRAALAAALFAALAMPCTGLDPHKAVTQYAQQVWKTDAGLPQNSIQAILQTRDGYLWLGTERGLVRFDGVQFTVFDKGNATGLRSSNVQVLFEDRDGRFWVGTWGGLHLYRDGRFQSWTTNEGLTNNRILSIAQDRSGAIWIGTGGGLNRLASDKGRLESFREGPTQSVWSIVEDREASLWFATDGGGLQRLREGKFTRFGEADAFPAGIVQALLVDSSGDLWIGTDGFGLARRLRNRFEFFSRKDGLSSDTIETLQEDRDGNLWIGTRSGGLARYVDGKFSALTPADGLSDDTVLAIREDVEGSLWVGTVSGGLNRLKDGKFTSYSQKEGLSSDRVRTVYEDHEGAIWLGTRGAGVNRFVDGKFTAFGAKDGLSGEFVRSIYEDGRDRLWVGTWGDGLDLLENGRFRAFGRKDGLPSEIVRCLYRDRAGTLWIGTDNGGLVAVREKGFQVYGVAEGLSSPTVLAIAEDRDGALWIGTENGGLNRFANDRFTAFTRKDGLSDDTVIALYEDDDGCLWIGTDGGGLSRYKNGRFSRITRREGLFDDVQYRILEDARGNLWMSCSRGIFQVSLRQLEDVAEGRRDRVTSISYGRADGMRSAECSGFTQPAGWRTRDGRLWFPTIEGAVVIDPDRIKTNATPPPVVIEEMLVDRQVVPTSGPAELLPGRGDLEFHYTGLSFVDPDRVRFRYMLEGFDGEWVEAGTRRTAFYTNIPPGRYTFRVIACNNDGVWNEVGASAHFRLRPNFRDTPWFYVVCAAALALSGYGVSRIRAARMRAREGELARQVTERTLQLEEANAKLQSLSELDALTGIANRRRFEETLAREWRRSVRDGLALSLVMIDIDHFKAFNDAQGHQLGDQCLRRVAHEIRSALTRPGDLLARYGGEEFAAILPSTPLRGAEAVAEVLRSRVEAMATRHPRSPREVVTISLGVATASPGRSVSPEALVAAADEALYRAKDAGRNRVESQLNTGPAGEVRASTVG
jgi:diguanylate cyclase (GGDEF)-like protein